MVRATEEAGGEAPPEDDCVDFEGEVDCVNEAVFLSEPEGPCEKAEEGGGGAGVWEGAGNIFFTKSSCCLFDLIICRLPFLNRYLLN